MIANEMRKRFQILYMNATPVDMGYNNEEISRFLTLAQLKYIKQRVFANRNEVGEGFEYGTKRTIELAELKKYALFINTGWVTGKYSNSVQIDLPNDYLYNIQELVDITHGGTVYTSVQVLPVNEDNYIEDIKNPFRQPNHRMIWRMELANLTVHTGNTDNEVNIKALLIGDSNTTINNYRLTYIRYPNDITVDTRTPSNQRHCELNESTHDEIVRLAVEMALGATGNEKYQIGIRESNEDV